MNTILAWHFTDGWRLRDGRPLVVGRTNHHQGKIELCNSGLHASRDPWDALQYAPGSVLSLVECWGDVQEQPAKLVCRHRKVLAARDIASELRLFVCDCVRHTPLADGRTVWGLLTDERSRHAVEVAERFARGEATYEELTAARAAARDAAWAAARAAAWAAASAAAVAASWCVAAWAAARAAARDAARDAAWAAARAAARDAAGGAGDAARDAAGGAGDAARSFQRQRFTTMIHELFASDLAGAGVRWEAK